MPSQNTSELSDKIEIIARAVLMGNHSYAMKALNGLPKKKAMVAAALVALTVAEQNSASCNTLLKHLENQAT